MFKRVNPGQILINEKHYYVFCDIKIEKGNLSITGVEGPYKNGNCAGSCGQITLTVDKLANGWDWPMVKEFKQIWKDYHLNDMRPYCSHQRDFGWGKKGIEEVTWSLTMEAYKEQRDIKERSTDLLKEFGQAHVTDRERFILNLKHTITYPYLDPELQPFYKKHKSEMKTSGWVYEKDHPDGQLGKPCPVCSYKYGTAWKKEELPQRVIQFLEGLPESELEYPWR